MRLVRATWVKLENESESHAVSAVVFGKLWTAYCGKQWTDKLTTEASADKLSRCDFCQRRVIEEQRVGVGLEELERATLWSTEMSDA